MFLRLIIFFILCGSLHAASVQEGHFVFTKSKKILNILSSHKDITIDHKRAHGFEVYGPKGLSKYLTMLNLNFKNLNSGLENSKEIDGYPTPEQIESKLKALAKGNESFVKLFSIGKSHNGRDLWVLKLSDNVEVNEVEPEVKYIANMHGNEIVGRELMVSLLRELIQKYKNKDPSVRNLINNTEVFILPSMNPDGAAKKRRGNNRYSDLNRDFPDFTTTDNNNDLGNREPETKAVMLFQAKHKFALSANFHGGSVVVNYPWDTHADDAPLTDLIVDLSKEYASEVPDMRNSSRFKDGIINGYRWYHVDGGMQDWSYYWYNDLQVTIELSNKKWPNYREIPRFYEDNRSSLIQYLKRVHQGAGFKQINSPKGKGQVEISTQKFLPIDKLQVVGTYPYSDGEFYKLLPEGKYQFKIMMDGGEVQIINVTVDSSSNIENGNYTTI